jgi:hypothetical protein
MRARQEFERDFYDRQNLFEDARESMDALDGRREEALYKKSCASKRRYATKAEARDAIRYQESLGKRGLTTYRCDYCKGYHLTSHGR